MKEFLSILIILLNGLHITAQTPTPNQFSYVVVPDKFDFLEHSDQYKLNSMAVFYFNKIGFNAYLQSKAPLVERCESLFADVEELKTILGTKLQVVLRDCRNMEIYRSEEGKSKLKDFEKAYQDALRKVFISMETNNFQPNDLVQPNTPGTLEEGTLSGAKEEGNNLPQAKFLNYSNEGNSFLLRKTSDGFSLYQETQESEDGLKLIGKIAVTINEMKFQDTSGNLFDVSFDSLGNLTIKNNATTKFYKLKD